MYYPSSGLRSSRRRGLARAQVQAPAKAKLKPTLVHTAMCMKLKDEPTYYHFICRRQTPLQVALCRWSQRKLISKSTRRLSRVWVPEPQIQFNVASVIHWTTRTCIGCQFFGLYQIMIRRWGGNEMHFAMHRRAWLVLWKNNSIPHLHPAGDTRSRSDHIPANHHTNKFIVRKPQLSMFVTRCRLRIVPIAFRNQISTSLRLMRPLMHSTHPNAQAPRLSKSIRQPASCCSSSVQ